MAEQEIVLHFDHIVEVQRNPNTGRVEMTMTTLSPVTREPRQRIYLTGPAAIFDTMCARWVAQTGRQDQVVSQVLKETPTNVVPMIPENPGG